MFCIIPIEHLHLCVKSLLIPQLDPLLHFQLKSLPYKNQIETFEASLLGSYTKSTDEHAAPTERGYLFDI